MPAWAERLRIFYLIKLNPTQDKRLHVSWLAVAVLLFAGYFGMTHIDAPTILIDELLSFGNMGGFNPPYSPAQIVQTLNHHSPDHVPVWYVLAAGLAHFTGWSQAALRATSVLTSLLMFALVYRFAAESFERRTALVALFLLCTNEAVLHYMYRIRMYPLVMLLAILHVWIYWRLAHHSAPRLSWLLFVLTAAASVYTHLFAVLLLIGLGINHLFFAARTRRWWQLIVAWVASGLFFLPYLPQVLSGFDHNLKNNSTDSVLDVALRLLADLVNGPSKYWLWIPLLVALAYAVHRKPSDRFFALLRISMIGCAGFLLLKLALDEALVTRIRYLFPVWFALVIPLAYALTAAPRWFLGLFVLAWCIGSYSDLHPRRVPAASNSVIFRPDALQSLAALPEPMDIIVNIFDSANPTFKIRHHGFSAADMYLREQGLDSMTLNTTAGAESVYGALYRNHARFMIGTDPSNPAPHYAGLIDLMLRDYVACASLINEPTMQVTHYVDRSLGCEHQPAPITYDSQITVIDRFARYLPKEKRLQILTWIDTANRQQQLEYNVSWQIITPNWRNVRQIDKHLHDSSVLPWSRIEMSTDGIEPGDYRLMLILYRSDNGAKSAYRDPSSGQESGFLPVLEFTISPDSG